MTLQFRNLNISPEAPVAEWPTDAGADRLGAGRSRRLAPDGSGIAP